MKIYTKRGDSGKTSLFGGAEVDKDDMQVVAYGTVDELNAVLGMSVAFGLATELSASLQEVQAELFVLGAELASSPSKTDKLKMALIGAPHIQRLEREIDAMETQLSPLQTFILPGGSQAGASLHLARTICRRAERHFVTLNAKATQRRELGIYLNRLSDFLFVAARTANQQQNTPDVPWIPQKN